jgi:hypothetical protein
MFTEDARHRCGNAPPTVGREERRRAATASHLAAMQGDRFHIQGLWEFGDVVGCDMESDYLRGDDATLTLPCTEVFRLEGNRINDRRISMDPSPRFACACGSHGVGPTARSVPSYRREPVSNSDTVRRVLSHIVRDRCSRRSRPCRWGDYAARA